jgi:hypothetical protein
MSIVMRKDPMTAGYDKGILMIRVAMKSAEAEAAKKVQVTVGK